MSERVEVVYTPDNNFTVQIGNTDTKNSISGSLVETLTYWEDETHYRTPEGAEKRANELSRHYKYVRVIKRWEEDK